MSGGPLEGVVVLDLGQYLAGPFGPMILGDLGAEVIKVEPVRGDGMRMAGQPFIGCQRGKKDIAVDVKSPEGLDVVMRLVERADVVHHNMTKGTAARLGLDYASVRARNPGIIYCNTYAYGPEGPLSEFGGLDPLYQAACGLEYEAGPVADGNPPLYLRFGMADTANALASVIGVLAALLHRPRTGQGQEMWTSLLNAAALLSSDAFLVEGRPGPARPPLDRGQMGTGPDHRLYEARDGWIQVVAVAPGQWDALTRVLGVSGAERDADGVARIEEAFRGRPAQEWLAALDRAGVPAEVSVDSNDGDLVLNDADNVRLGLVASYPHPTLGQMRQFGTLIDFSDTPTGPYGPPPLLGQHTREIMLDLGYTAEEIDEHVRAGVVYEPDSDYRFSV